MDVSKHAIACNNLPQCPVETVSFGPDYTYLGMLDGALSPSEAGAIHALAEEHDLAAEERVQIQQSILIDWWMPRLRRV